MTTSQHVYEVRPRSDKRGVDLISDVLPFGRLWYGEPNAVSNAIGYAEFDSRSHDAVIRVYDDAAPQSPGSVATSGNGRFCFTYCGRPAERKGKHCEHLHRGCVITTADERREIKARVHCRAPR